MPVMSEQGFLKAEAMFWRDVGDKARMAKCRAMPDPARWNHKPNRRGFAVVDAEEVLQKLEGWGVLSPKTGKRYSERTLRDYAKSGLIPKPDTKSLGPKVGRVTNYKDETPAEFYASHCLKHGIEIGIKLTTEKVAMVRAAALKAEADPVLLKSFIIRHNASLEDDDGKEWAVESVYYRTPDDLPIPGGGVFMAAWLSRRADAELTELGAIVPGHVRTVYSILKGEVKREIEISDNGGLWIG